MNSIVITDGGREAAGFSSSKQQRDCVCRAIAIATGRDYATIHDELALVNASLKMTAKRKRTRNFRRSPSDGVYTRNKPFRDYMATLGFRWVPTMRIGTGCRVHLVPEELPRGRIIAVVSRHYVAVINRVIHDTHDASRGGTRCVYGYWTLDKTS